MENKEYWDKEIDKCIEDSEYFYNNYIVIRNWIEIKK